MGALTESEIFDCLTSNLQLAAQHAEDLAKLPRKGPTYLAFRDEIKLVEGACKQASAWREDTRWLKLGLMMGEAHKRAGDWLRGIKLPSGVRVKIREGELHPLFMMLAVNLRNAARIAEEYRNKATGKLGMILPTPLPGPHRDTRPVGFTSALNGHPRVSAGGIIIPDSLAAQ
jgi:hypothetical protein